MHKRSTLKSKSLPISDSDHNSVATSVMLNLLLRINELNCYQYSKRNWLLLETHIIDKLNSIPSVTDQQSLDVAIDRLHVSITGVRNSAVPKWKSLPKELPSHMHAMKRERNRFRRQSQHPTSSISENASLKTVANHRNFQS